jgi:hypothetical protein
MPRSSHQSFIETLTHMNRTDHSTTGNRTGHPSTTNHTVTGNNFLCRIEDGYIYDHVWGTISIAEAEACTATLIDMAARTGYRKLIVDINELNWISNIALRLRGMELFHKGASTYDHLALVSLRPAIIYLVSAMARAGGFDAKSFPDREPAAVWLRSR